MSARAFLTGGASGIGRAIATMLVSEGYRVAISARAHDRAATAAGEIGAELGLACDVRSPESVRDAVNCLLESFGGLDLLVNNAGVAEFFNVDKTSEAVWAAMIDTNLSGTFRVTKACLPSLLDGGGMVINVLSTAARTAFPGSSAYVASKFGQLGFAESLRAEYRDRGLRVVNILPGAVDTPIWDNIEGDWDRSKMLRPKDVAEVARTALRAPAATLVEEIRLGPAGGAL
ncbi:SDR family NAD(P)-dependent oxidoreductase [bacterium]|nr:SDR family NAD(P)-dependent oxidoreductase [bacterium]